MRFDEQRATDRLAPIRDIFERVVAVFRQTYNLTEHLTLDEAQEVFRGRCGFVQNMLLKPTKYGIKLQCLSDAQINYICNMEMHPGKQPDGPFQLSNKPYDIKLRQRLIYHCVPLAENFLKNKETLVGTMKKKKPRHSPEMMPKRYREQSVLSLIGCNGSAYCVRNSEEAVTDQGLTSDNSKIHEVCPKFLPAGCPLKPRHRSLEQLNHLQSARLLRTNKVEPCDFKTISKPLRPP
ncbi:Hypothetical predicted protein [Octopus vulgaris]|uniref:PiggyBac transposable element-derived protein domain-containing protein n=1 Tax=Octopus vulgaris TaxID=6645 RepID=A0AA36F2L0_OCTVU|nr:Hypothetical predicted protein [Octopus vulgaris]